MLLYLGYKLVFLAVVAIVTALGFSQDFQGWGFVVVLVFSVGVFLFPDSTANLVPCCF